MTLVREWALALRRWLLHVVGAPDERAAKVRAIKRARARRALVRELASRPFPEVDERLGVRTVGDELPHAGYVTPRNYPRQEVVSDRDVAEAERALARR